MYAKITFWSETSQRLKRNDSTEEQCHVAQTRLHKIQHRSFLIPHSQIWIHYPHFYLPRRNFMSRHPVEPMASCPYPHVLFWHLFLSWRQPMHFLSNLCSQVHTTSSQHTRWSVILGWRSSVAKITDVPVLPSFHKSSFSAWASCSMISVAKCRALSAVANKVRKCSRRSKLRLLPEVSAPRSESKANAMC